MKATLLLGIAVLFLIGCNGISEPGTQSLSSELGRRADPKLPSVTPDASASAYVLVEHCEPYEDPDDDDLEIEEEEEEEYPIEEEDGKGSRSKGGTYIYCDGYEPVPLSLLPNSYNVKVVPPERVKEYPANGSDPGDILQTLLFGNPGPCPANANACTEIDLRPLASPNFGAILAQAKDDPVMYGFTEGYAVLPMPFGMGIVPEVYPKAPDGGEDMEIKIQVHIWKLSEADAQTLRDAGISPSDIDNINRMQERLLWEEKCHAAHAEEFVSYVGELIDMPGVPSDLYATAEDAAQAVRDEYAKSFNQLFADFNQRDDTDLHQALSEAEIEVPLEGFFGPDGSPVTVPVFGPDASEALSDFTALCDEPPVAEDDIDYPDDQLKTSDYSDDYPVDGDDDGDTDDDDDGDTDYEDPNPMCGDLPDEQDLCPGFTTRFVGWSGWTLEIDVDLIDDLTVEVSCIARYRWNGRPEDIPVPSPTPSVQGYSFDHRILVDYRHEITGDVVWECDMADLTWKFSYLSEGYDSEWATASGYSASEDWAVDENGNRGFMGRSLDLDLQFTVFDDEYSISKHFEWDPENFQPTGVESVSIRGATANGSTSASLDRELYQGHLVSDSVSHGTVERTSGGALDLVTSSGEDRTYGLPGEDYNWWVTSEMIWTSSLDYEPYNQAGGNPGVRYLANRTETLERKSENVLDEKFTAIEEAVERTAVKNGTIMYMGSRQVQLNSFDYEDRVRTFYRSTNYETHNSSNQPIWDSGRPLTLYVVSNSPFPSESGRIFATWSADSNGNWVTSMDCDDLESEVEKLSGVESGLPGGSSEHYPTDGCQGGYP